MKRYSKYVIIGLLFTFACSDYFEDINVDPNNPIEVTPNVLLPQIQVRLAYTYNGDASRYVGIYTQHVDGIGRQFVVIHNYGIQPDDVDNLWGRNMYAAVLADNRQLGRLAEEGGYNHYTGISKVIEAYGMMLITDLFGDAPYTEAFQGLNLLQPKFDTQESIYTAILGLLEQARADFNQDNGGFAPGQDDLIYGGNMSRWLKFANVLEARARLHLADRDAASYQNALNALARGGFESAADDARIRFGTGPTSSSPWYQYIEQRDDIEVGDSYRELLSSMSDPRFNSFGALLEIPSHPVFVRDRAAPLLTFVEQKFIESESAFQTGAASQAYAAYKAGIQASLTENIQYYGRLAEFTINDNTVSIDQVDFNQVNNDYLSSPAVDPGDGNLTLQHIIMQKYIALYADPEVFSDWRRTGIPQLTPNVGNEVPRRLPYAENEILSNENTPSPANVNIFTRVWWDMQ